VNLLHFEPNNSIVPICEVDQHQLPAGGAAAVDAEWRRPSYRRAGVARRELLQLALARILGHVRRREHG
jgi:hypothetical protein